MAQKRKTAPTKQPVFDVSRPGKSAAPATSKAVIVTNHTIIKDPMVTAEAPAPEAVAVPVTASQATTRKVIQPISGQPEPVADSEPVAEAASTMSPESPALPVSEPAKQVAQVEPEPAFEVPQADTLPGQAVTPEEADKAEAAREVELEKLIESKQYYLPITTVEQRRTTRVVIGGTFVSVVLLLMWVNVALDAGLIELGGLRPVTHFFSN